MLDYSFFALLFYIASALAPGATAERTWVNGRHPEQSITWTRGTNGWALTVNGREVGLFRRDGDAIVHDTRTPSTPDAEPRRFPIAQLAAHFGPDADRITLRGSFAPATLTVERAGQQVTLSDPSRHLLRTELILRGR